MKQLILFAVALTWIALHTFWALAIWFTPGTLGGKFVGFAFQTLVILAQLFMVYSYKMSREPAKYAQKKIDPIIDGIQKVL